MSTQKIYGDADFLGVITGAGGGGSGIIDFTTGNMDINVDWATGYDGPDPGEVTFHDQTEVDDYLTSKSATAFKYPTKVWDNAIPQFVNHRVRFYPAMGVHRPENPLPADAIGAWDFCRKSVAPKIFGDFGYVTLYQDNSGANTYYDTWESLHGDLGYVSKAASPDGGITPPSIQISGASFTPDSLIGYYVIVDSNKNGIRPIVGNTADTLYLTQDISGTPTVVRICSPGIIFRNSYDDVNKAHSSRTFNFDGFIQGCQPYIVNFDSIRIDQMGSATGVRIKGIRLEMWGCLFDHARQKDDFGANSFGVCCDEQLASTGRGQIGGQLWSTNFRGPRYAAVPGTSSASWGPINFDGRTARDQSAQLNLLWGCAGGFQTWRMEFDNGTLYFNSFRCLDWNTGGAAVFYLTRMIVRFATSQACLSGFVRVNYTGISFSDCEIWTDTNSVYNQLMFEGQISTSYVMFHFANDNKMVGGGIRLRQGLTANAGVVMGVSGPRNDLMFAPNCDLAGAAGDIRLYDRDYGSGATLYREWTWAQLDLLRAPRHQPKGTLLGAVTVEKIETGTALGNASLRYTNAGTTLEYHASGDTYGATVDVSGGGYFTLHSNNGKVAVVYVEPTALPGSDDEQVFEVTRGWAEYPWIQNRIARRFA